MSEAKTFKCGDYISIEVTAETTLPVSTVRANIREIVGKTLDGNNKSVWNKVINGNGEHVSIQSVVDQFMLWQAKHFGEAVKLYNTGVHDVIGLVAGSGKFTLEAKVNPNGTGSLKWKPNANADLSTADIAEMKAYLSRWIS